MGDRRGRIFRIAGVSGSGKTTLTALVSKLSRETGVPFVPVDTKTIQCELAGVKNEKQYRQIPEEKRRILFPLLIQRIVDISNLHTGQIWVFERHMCSMNEDGSIIERGVPEEHGPNMIGQGIIVAHECQIDLQRRMEKKVRHDRHLLRPEQIAVEQIREIELAAEASRRWNFPLRLFFNESGQSVKVASEILDFLNGIVE